MNNKGTKYGIILLLLILALTGANLLFGSVNIPAEAVWHILTGNEVEKASWSFIVWESRLPQAITALLCGMALAASGLMLQTTFNKSRLPQAITALLCGMALAASGLMLQTTFNNPLADPSILGISSGASLGVALVMLAGAGTITAGVFTLSGFLSVIIGAFIGSMLVMGIALVMLAGAGTITAGVFTLSGFLSVIIGAFIGSMLVMGIILFFSTLIKNSIMLLIIGIMIGYITSSAISLLNFFSTAEGVHSYMIWGMGNFGGVSLQQLPFFSLVTAAGLLITILLIKPLNALLLGTRYAENLGINIRRTRNLLLVATGLLTATTTAFCGPISFIGLAVPHIARLMLGTSNHNSLLPVTMLTGGAIALLCNFICILPGEAGIIPLNAVTPVIGAPIIIYVIVNQRKIQYFN